MAIPSRVACERSGIATEYRNKMYLRFIFDHPESVCDNTFMRSGGVYYDAFDYLVALKFHGAPGSGIAQTSTYTSFQRAVELSQSWNHHISHSCLDNIQYFTIHWGNTYRRFRSFQRELVGLRHQIEQNDYSENLQSGAVTTVYICEALKEMLKASVHAWYLKWGELDLHLLRLKPAVQMILDVLTKPRWREIRIVSGQQARNGPGYRSSGILYSIIGQIFGDTIRYTQLKDTRAKAPVAMCRKLLAQEDITVNFYSAGAAVHLKRKVPAISRTVSDYGTVQEEGEYSIVRRKRGFLPPSFRRRVPRRLTEVHRQGSRGGP